jgi:hypothetical protein
MSQQAALFGRLGRRRNRTAVERTVQALRSSDRLQDVDAALLAAVRSSAEALDAAPNPYVTATVLRVHLEGLRLLTGRPAPERDELDAFLQSLRRPAVPDAPES